MTTTPAATAPTRIQQNILARSERRLLNWICPRLPHWVTPDQLTALGFAGALLVAAGYMLSWIDDEWLGLCLAGYIVDGLTQNGWLGLATALACLVAVMLAIRARVPVADE